MSDITDDPRAMAELRRRFVHALELVHADSECSALFDVLVARHEEAQRHYHTLEHVDACLGWLDWFMGIAERPGEVALALWFHDAIYDPRAHDNEERSATLARTELGALGVPAAAIERVVSHVLATKSHESDGNDSRLVVDIDLTILGSTPAVFADFERRIRREYAHVPLDTFKSGRRYVLERFLDRPAIYRLLPLRERLEEPARANLKRRIEELSRPNSEAGPAGG